MVCLGAVSLGLWWNHADLAAPYWRLYLNRADGAGLRTAAGPLPLRADRLYLIPAHLSYSTRPAVGVGHVFAHFDLPGLPVGLTRAAFNRPFILADDRERAARFIAIGNALAEGALPDLAMILTARTLVDSCLAEVYSGLPEAERKRLESALLHRGRLATVLARIEADPGAAHPNAALAAIAGVGTDHLIRLFRRHLGLSPARHVAERRLASAARALAFGDGTIEEIAEAHGFANRFGFTRAFTRRFGCGPAAWRNRCGS